MPTLSSRRVKRCRWRPSYEPGETVSSVARRNGVAANLLYRWRRLMSEGEVTVGSDEPVFVDERPTYAIAVLQPW